MNSEGSVPAVGWQAAMTWNFEFFAVVVIAGLSQSQPWNPSCDLNHYNIVILSDIHIGAGAEVTSLAQSAVKKINSIAEEANICLVFITGDLTNSALPSQYADVKQILDQLTVPYIPTIGNHDIWSYNSTWEEVFPTGDALFANTFKENLAHTSSYNNVTRWNPIENIFSWFQNWELRVGNTMFVSLDWNSREHAVAELGYKGSMPGAELYNFPGGTLPWLAETLQQIPSDIEMIVLLQHQPFKSPWYIPGFIYAFSDEQDDEVQQVLAKYQPVSKYWGVFAGHYHMWSNGTAFDDWPSFIQWETDACKVAAAITLVTVENDRIIKLEKLYGNSTDTSI